jgi:hypothetical protein
MKTILTILLFLVSFNTTYADSFLLISSPESYVSKENFMGSGDGVKIIQEQIQKCSQIIIIDPFRPEKPWYFSIEPMETLVRIGIHKTVTSSQQEKSFSDDDSATLAVSFSTDGRGNNRNIGIARIHEADYSLGKSLRRLSIDILIFGEGSKKSWNYLEIRQNSRLPHTVQISKPEDIPSLFELEKLFEQE